MAVDTQHGWYMAVDTQHGWYMAVDSQHGWYTTVDSQHILMTESECRMKQQLTQALRAVIVQYSRSIEIWTGNCSVCVSTS